MNDVASLIADLISAGTPADLVGRVAAALAERPDEGVSKASRRERNQRYYEGRKRLKASESRLNSDVLKPTENVLKRLNSDASRVRDNLLKLVPSGEDITQEDKSSFVATAKKSRRCPPSWLPSSTTLIAIDATTFTPGEIERELAKFRDHQFRDAKSDWDATFRNWIRTADERRPKSESPKFTARQANLARSANGAEAAARFLDAKLAGEL